MVIKSVYDSSTEFELRTEVVALVQEPQSDEPPGRAPFRTRTHVLAKTVKKLHGDDVEKEIRNTLGIYHS